MKLHLPSFSKEWKRQLIGGAAVGGLYLVIALLTGLTDKVSRTAFPPLGSILGVAVGCIYLVLYFLLLEYASGRIASGALAERGYLKGYLSRYLLAAAALLVGFIRLDPFAVFVTMLSPRITYLFCVLTGREI